MNVLSFHALDSDVRPEAVRSLQVGSCPHCTGPFSTVYRAHCDSRQQDMALKILPCAIATAPLPPDKPAPRGTAEEPRPATDLDPPGRPSRDAAAAAAMASFSAASDVPTGIDDSDRDMRAAVSPAARRRSDCRRKPDWRNELSVYELLAANCGDEKRALPTNIRPLLAYWWQASPGSSGPVCLHMLFPWLPASLADILRCRKQGDASPARRPGYYADNTRRASSTPELLPVAQQEALRTVAGRWRCVEMLMGGLAYLHQLHIVHRDIKPDNLLINADGVLQIADFGLARALPAAELSSSAGTRQYRAPEMLFGSCSYDCQVDMWAAGCVTFEVFTAGRLLFDCQLDSDIAQLALIISVLGDPLSSGRGWPEMTRLPDYGKVAFPQRKPAQTIAARFRAATAPPGETPGRTHIRSTGPEKVVVLLEQLLVYNPQHRLSARAALDWMKESDRVAVP
ncbi:uncharacterized protein LOC129587363 [Paramacrobiotus metropolitanus]|uniref:uncharacterized protein LOC129587363 n=1 Tax=Paramacrobiotus metropolitanus TaxID=2943436 RepID=UPI0024456AEA|nr:uncharacterized protein LOC129587363 [Paramacrobiotus metropolitanus]